MRCERLSRSATSSGRWLNIAGFPSKGVSARSLSRSILDELKRVSDLVLAEEADRDADFARVLASQREFAIDYARWKSIAYLPADLGERRSGE